MGATVADLRAKLNALEEGLDCSATCWYDRGLLWVELGTHRLPEVVEFGRFCERLGADVEGMGLPIPLGESKVGRLVREIQQQQPHDDDVVRRLRRQGFASVVDREPHIAGGATAGSRRRDSGCIDVHPGHACPRVKPGELARELSLATPQIQRRPFSAGIQPGHTECLAEPEKEVLQKEMGPPFQSYSFVEVLGE